MYRTNKALRKKQLARVLAAYFKFAAHDIIRALEKRNEDEQRITNEAEAPS